MYVTPNDMTTYWDWISGHDLALILDCQGRLWQFRRRTDTPVAWHASVDSEELVITTALPDAWDEVAVRVRDHVIELLAGPLGPDVIGSDVALASGCGFDETNLIMSRSGGAIEIRVPRLRDSLETPAVASSMQAA
jgi:hypothetical protein